MTAAEREIRPRVRKGQRDGLADAAAGSGNHHHPALQIETDLSRHALGLLLHSNRVTTSAMGTRSVRYW
jgi:hypothetical protein